MTWWLPQWTDRTMGWLLLTSTLLSFSYYTIWVLIMPFVDEDHAMRGYFPSNDYALFVPVVAMLLAGSALLSFFALIMTKSQPRC